VIRNTASILLPAPPARVFEYLVDGTRLRQWVGGLLESTPLQDGPPRPGAAYRQVIQLDAKRETVERVITEHDPPAATGFRVRLANMDMEGRFELEPEGEGTRLTFTQETTPGGLAALAGGMIERRIGAKIAADLQNLKRALERPA